VSDASASGRRRAEDRLVAVPVPVIDGPDSEIHTILEISEKFIKARLMGAAMLSLSREESDRSELT
jgi:hypothetical protein